MESTPTRPAVPSTASDLELLRAFEPVVRYTKGEQFYPTDVERYIQHCSLWVHYPDGRDIMLVPDGELTLETLTQPREAPFGSVEYLRLVSTLTLQESAALIQQHQSKERSADNVFHAGQGRLARGGLLPRIADAGFSISLLMRGRVPGAVAAAAEVEYEDSLKHDEKYEYYGRVVRQGGWVALQYWFFFFFNSWRSGFHGVNDHESDWEMILVYLFEDEGKLYPEWVAYASHDFHGDDLRRHWSDRGQLDLVGSHPVIYAGAGSHASYFRRGEYQASIALPLPTRLATVIRALTNFWHNTLGQAGRQTGNPFRIPFVDFARGDGLSIGPGQAKEWTPLIVSESTPWAAQYRGLWGLFARDPVSGENAPAGPMYNRDGSPRSSWFDPLGFAGLNKVPPPPVELQMLEQRKKELESRQSELAKEIPARTSELQELGTELKAMQGQPHLANQFDDLQKTVNVKAGELTGLLREKSENQALIESLSERLERRRAGILDNPRAHIRKLAEPVSPSQMRFAGLAEWWAAVSLSALLLGFVALLIFFPNFVFLGAILMLIAFILLESFLRGTFVGTVNTIAVVLAIIAAVVLLSNFWWELVVALLVGAALFLLFQKLGELRA